MSPVSTRESVFFPNDITVECSFHDGPQGSPAVTVTVRAVRRLSPDGLSGGGEYPLVVEVSGLRTNHPADGTGRGVTRLEGRGDLPLGVVDHCHAVFGLDGDVQVLPVGSPRAGDRTSADLGRNLNLNAIAIGLGLENIEYEPEQFPGLVYRLDEPEVVALLFGSGKLVITGGKKPEDAEHAVDKIVSRLEDLGLLE